MLTAVIKRLMDHQDLSALEATAALNHILGDADPLQVAALLVLLHSKGETAQELGGLVAGMQAVMHPLNLQQPVLDIVGTGGDGAHTVNISTAASIVAASCGAVVAKHGNRSVSSKCGSADLLEEIGVKIDLTPEQVSQCIDAVGIGFCFAPVFHPAMKKIKNIRRALKVPTTFNLLGPLLNPARAQYAVVGVFDERYLQLFADTLQQLKVTHALVVHGCGLDELSCLGPASVIEVSAAGQRELTIDPKDYGLDYCQLDDLKGGDAAYNAALIRSVFAGKPGPLADTIALNAGAGLYVAGVVKDIQQGVDLALAHLRSGQVNALLEKWVVFSSGEMSHA